jgi:hypothetical protein
MATERPLLTLKVPARPETRTGGGKGRRSIKLERLAPQTAVLSGEAATLASTARDRPAFAGRVHLVARMFDDSFATTHTPNDLFEAPSGFEIVAALDDGYLIEAGTDALRALPGRIHLQRSAKIQADISRVESLSFFKPAVLSDDKRSAMWNSATSREGGRLFFAWLVPTKSAEAREAVLAEVDRLRTGQIISLAPMPVLASEKALVPRVPDRLEIARREYRRTGAALLPVVASSERALAQLMGSGTVVRVDPVRPIGVAAPGEGVEPSPPVDLSQEPVVAVIDGGRTAPSYDHAEAWRATPTYVGDGDADARHGNAVVSLVVNGHAWNNNRRLPPLNCRVGIVQAVPKPNSGLLTDELDLLDYLAAVARTQPTTRVWNISANVPPVDGDHVSVFGHGLAKLARAASILPVVSIGNTSEGDRRLQPPADCEAALVVTGCSALSDGSAGAGCPACARGPGPQLMQKPDVSNFSELRFLGGVTARGSSYATAITSPLAAHTIARLKDPEPDLARAILLHATPRRSHDPEIGWGAPYNGHLPWECPPGTATFLFMADLQPGNAYYWNLPVPPSMLRDGKLVGGFKLTAILQPLLSSTGTSNYFGSRLETNLQFRNRQNKTQALLGKLDESETAEQEARTDFAKWQPVRHFPLVMIPRGRAQSGDMIRLYARVYTRDRFQFNFTNNEEAPVHRAAFVLSMVAPGDEPDFYNMAAARMGNLVENALDVEIENMLEQSIDGADLQ